MSEQTNPQTESAAMTDEELEQVNGGYKAILGQKLPTNFFMRRCSEFNCTAKEQARTTNRVYKGCPFAD